MIKINYMKKTFYNLPAKRQEEILNIAMEDFIENGYEHNAKVSDNF